MNRSIVTINVDTESDIYYLHQVYEHCPNELSDVVYCVQYDIGESPVLELYQLGLEFITERLKRLLKDEDCTDITLVAFGGYLLTAQLKEEPDDLID